MSITSFFIVHKVNFEFGDEEKQPGSQTTVRVTSSPNSLCGLRIVDKSVSLLDSSQQLTEDKIFQLIDDLNPNNYFYSSNPCFKDIPQPGKYKHLKIKFKSCI
ncbi:UNVERIFIED_CONTAM: Ovostatin-like protein 2 [Trichonephila clavipes]